MRRKSEEEELRSDIQSMVNGMGESDTPVFDVEPIQPLDNYKVTEQAKTKAQKVVLSCLKLYFDEKIISKNEFLQAKSAVTVSNIKTLFQQIKIAEHFVNKIVNAVDNGDLNPRLFEVASGIQSNIIEMLKNTQLHVISMQEEFRRMQSEMPKSELQGGKTIDISSETETSDGVYTNSKALLNDLAEEDDEEDDED